MSVLNEKQRPEDPSLQDLSDDALRVIFKFLDLPERLRLESVCKRWEELMKESWKSVRTLTMSHFQAPVKFDPPLMPQFDSGRKCLLPERVATVLSRNLLSVESIDFWNTDFREGHISLHLTSILEALGTADLPSLTQLNLHTSHMDTSVVSSLELFPRLLKLKIDEREEDRTPHRSLEGSSPFGNSEGATELEAALSELFKSLCQLREISVPTGYVGSYLKDLSPSLSKANLFRPSRGLGFGGHVSLGGFLSPPRISLSQLRLPGCRVFADRGDLAHLVSGAPNLSLLDLSHTVGFRNFKELAGFRQLTCLYMNGTKVSWDEPGTVPDEEEDEERPFLFHLGRSQSRHSLHTLHMNSFSPFSSDRDQGLHHIARLPLLKELSLEHSNQLTTRNLDFIAQGCTELECLFTHHCLKVEDGFLATIGRQCPNIRYLDITRCPGVTLEGLKALLSGLHTSAKRQEGTPLAVYMGDCGVSEEGVEGLEDVGWLDVDTQEMTLSPRHYDGPGPRVETDRDPCLGLPVVPFEWMELLSDDGDDSWFDDDSEDNFSDVMDDVDLDDPEFYPRGHFGYDSFDDEDYEDEEDPP